MGGPLAVEDRFLAKSRILRLVNLVGERTVIDNSDMNLLYQKDFLSFHHPLTPMPAPPLDTDPVRAIQKAKQRQKLFEQLPGKDCGACGAPDCQTLADDVIRGRALLADCPFVQKEKK